MTSLAEFMQEKREKAGYSIYGLADRAALPIEVLEDISQHDIEKYELENPDKYILDEDNLDDDFDEDQIGWDLIFGEDDVWQKK